MAGLYPIMMFALPAVALAIVHESREDLRPKVRKTYMTAALVSLLTGITEPIEFAFLFAAPYLFIVHALLSGPRWITAELGVRHGFSFSAGAIDYIVNFHQSKGALWIIPIGIAFALIYYVVFRFAIQKFQIPTLAGWKDHCSTIWRAIFCIGCRSLYRRSAARIILPTFRPALPG